MNQFNILHDRYRLRFEKWWEEPQSGSGFDDRDGKVNIEIHVIWIATCSIFIEDNMNVERKRGLT